MRETAVALISAFFGSLGFSLLFGLRRGLLIPASLGGVLCWGVYLVAGSLTPDVFAQCLIASAFSALYAEVLAHVLHAPVTLFFIPSVVPLVPGGSLFYAMQFAVAKDLDSAAAYGRTTALITLGIAVGISLVWALCYMSDHLHEKLRR